jgi:hypothetical protein
LARQQQDMFTGGANVVVAIIDSGVDCIPTCGEHGAIRGDGRGRQQRDRDQQGG